MSQSQKSRLKYALEQIRKLVSAGVRGGLGYWLSEVQKIAKEAA